MFTERVVIGQKTKSQFWFYQSMLRISRKNKIKLAKIHSENPNEWGQLLVKFSTGYINKAITDTHSHWAEAKWMSLKSILP